MWAHGRRGAASRRGVGEQLCLEFPNTWGGARKGAGRKRRLARSNVAHRLRPAHTERNPLHVTVRVVLRSLRSQFVFPTVAGVIADTNRRHRERFRILEFSIQADHAHLIVEAQSKAMLSMGMRSFSVRLARRVNRLLFRRGRLIADRWHQQPLTTPRAVRHALVYVLGNFKKHEGRVGGPIDLCSSAPYFANYAEFAGDAPCVHEPKLLPQALRLRSPPTALPTSWLLRVGWLRHGRISVREGPAQGRSKPHRAH